MSSVKLKKKSKSSKIPEPIKIKREDDHLIYPMEHYVDDRVELIRQIFSSLKPKTITNLAPDFLKKQKQEEIQEACLNEILGISKKRLLSIINSTKCPTDTETSSEDEVNAVAEHISLEEISSDSDIEQSKSSGKKKPQVKQETENNKQFSVLELLELQARARAIRSQLALEPVTKIEVDTDSDEDGPPKQKTPSAPSDAARRKASNKTTTTNGNSANIKTDATKKTTTSTLTVIIPNGEPVPAKRIKLKRNFRKQTRENDGGDNVDTTEPAKKSPEKVVAKNEIRSQSPDVIPIVSVPETLCISDSDEEKKKTEKSDKNDDVGTKSSEKLKILSVVNIETSAKVPEKKQEGTDESPKQNTSSNEIDPQEESEEEGEIVTEDEEEEPSTSKDPNTTEENSAKSVEHNEVASSKQHVDSENPEQTQNKDDHEESVDEEKPLKTEILDHDDYDYDNDDVISLEGEDVVNEMKEHMTDEVEEIAPKQEIIYLDDSSDEDAKRKKAESWNDRWLNSRKVSKVLATSRLGNKVRNKIKASKKAKKMEEAAAIEKEQEKNHQMVFVSKHELGSVEQYKEILETLPRKSTID